MRLRGRRGDGVWHRRDAVDATPSTRRHLRYTAKVAKFQKQFDELPPEKMEPYELPEGTTDDDADAYVEHLSSRAAAKGNMGIILRGNRETISRRWRRAPEI